MTLTLKGLNKRNTQAIYVGARTAIRVGTSNFPNNIPANSLELSDVLGPREKKTSRAKMTKEERARLPKPTAAERIQRMEAQLAKAKAKLLQADRVSM